MTEHSRAVRALAYLFVAHLGGAVLLLGAVALCLLYRAHGWLGLGLVAWAVILFASLACAMVYWDSPDDYCGY